MTPAQLSVAFFLQLAVILATCRGIGWVARRWLGQPQVVGEMLAGIVLGPSLFGLLAPGLQAALFPVESRPVLFVLAQLGVGLYMFLVGLGFRREEFRAHARGAIGVSLSGMAAPFLVAVAITPWLMRVPGLFGQGTTLFQATLFLGAAIAITAFPMLARIIHERGLTGTPVGTLSLAAGAIDDAAAWGVLAVVLASAGDGAGTAWRAILGGIAYAAVMILFGRKLLAPLGRGADARGQVGHGLLAIVLILFALSAWAMDAIGIHAVFGGFLLGTAMPRGLLSREVSRLLEPIVVVMLLPLFFTYSGLATRLDLIGDPRLLLVTAVLLAGSMLAKGGACWAAARLSGHDNPTAVGIGALMNARGLMELIIIGIGLQRGIIQPPLYAMLVLMAVATTLLASPVFEWTRRRSGAAGPG